MALILQAKPGTNQDAMYQLLTKTSLDLGTAGLDTSYGYGRIQAEKAVFGSTLLSQEQRLDIEQEFAFTINPDGTITKSVVKENPLWAMDVKVWITVLAPSGTYSGTFSIAKDGKPTQNGQINNLPSGQLYYVGQFHAYDGEHTLNLNAKYTGAATGTQGTIRVKIQAQ
jgi:hypothetical protein